MKSSSTIDELMLAELAAIKRLLVFALTKADASQKEIAVALGIDQSQVSRMFGGPKPRARRSGKGRK